MILPQQRQQSKALQTPWVSHFSRRTRWYRKPRQQEEEDNTTQQQNTTQHKEEEEEESQRIMTSLNWVQVPVASQMGSSQTVL